MDSISLAAYALHKVIPWELVWSGRAKSQRGKKDSVLHLQYCIKEGEEVTGGGKSKGMRSRPMPMRALCFLHGAGSCWSIESRWDCHHHHCLGKQGDSSPDILCCRAGALHFTPEAFTDFLWHLGQPAAPIPLLQSGNTCISLPYYFAPTLFTI